jgi:uncharacterized protein
MQAKRISVDGAETAYLLVLEDGDEVVAVLREFVAAEKLRTCRFTAIGALSDLVLGCYETSRRDYTRIPVNEQVEVLTLAGNVTEADGQARVHAHIVIGRQDGTTLGGHLLEGHVRPTLELFLTAWPVRTVRRLDERSGLMLIDLHERTLPA